MKYPIILLLMFFSLKSSAQVVGLVYDAKNNWVNTTKYLEDKEAQLKERVQNLELISKTAEVLKNAKETKEKIEEMWKLQDQIRKELKVCAEGVKGLNFKSLVYAGSELTGESFNPSDYIPETELTTSLKQTLNYNYSEGVTTQTKHVLQEWITSNPRNTSDLLSYTKELGNMVTNNNEYRTKNEIAKALEDMDFTKNFDIAMDSIMNILNSDNTLELSDAERLDLNLRVSELRIQNRKDANAARLVMLEINQRINTVRMNEYKIKLNFKVLESFMDSTLQYRVKPSKIPRLASFDKSL